MIIGFNITHIKEVATPTHTEPFKSWIFYDQLHGGTLYKVGEFTAFYSSNLPNQAWTVQRPCMYRSANKIIEWHSFIRFFLMCVVLFQKPLYHWCDHLNGWFIFCASKSAKTTFPAIHSAPSLWNCFYLILLLNHWFDQPEKMDFDWVSLAPATIDILSKKLVPFEVTSLKCENCSYCEMGSINIRDIFRNCCLPYMSI